MKQHFYFKLILFININIIRKNPRKKIFNKVYQQKKNFLTTSYLACVM